jgi:hypothetical protein
MFGLGRIGRLGASGATPWLLNTGGAGGTPSIDMDFMHSRYFGASPAGLTVARASQGTDLVYTAAAGASFATSSNNIARIKGGAGLLVEESRTNSLLNSTAPVTQTTASLGTGGYTLWVNGSGSAAVSAGSATITGAGSATNGTPLIFTVTVAGTVTVTVTGSLNAFQLENGASATSLIPTTGAAATRAADIITLTSPPVFGSAYTLFGKGMPQSPAAYTISQGVVAINNGLNNRLELSRNNSNGNFLGFNASASVGNVIGNGPVWTQNVSGKLAVTSAASDQASSFNGGAVSTGAFSLPVGVNAVSIGNQGDNASQLFNGFVERIAIWPSARVPNAQLQSITT